MNHRLTTPPPPTTSSTTSSQQQSFTSLPSTSYFPHSLDISLPCRESTFRVYDTYTPSTSLVLILLHGGGQTALSWALFASHFRTICTVMAYDARAHGNTISTDESDLSANVQVTDALTLIPTYLQQRQFDADTKIILAGHSMGGAIAVRIASDVNCIPNLIGLVVFDVVEGSAMCALPYMRGWLERRASVFGSVQKAVQYVVKAGHVRNVQSARISVPSQLKYCEKKGKWIWRTKLEESISFWKGWFEGLSALFLKVDVPKLLVLANVNRLDRELMIAQMQGKFQNVVIPQAGHSVQEDQPERAAQAVLAFMRRNLWIDGGDGQIGIFQQRDPIPPCC